MYADAPANVENKKSDEKKENAESDVLDIEKFEKKFGSSESKKDESEESNSSESNESEEIKSDGKNSDKKASSGSKQSEVGIKFHYQLIYLLIAIFFLFHRSEAVMPDIRL